MAEINKIISFAEVVATAIKKAAANSNQPRTAKEGDDELSIPFAVEVPDLKGERVCDLDDGLYPFEDRLAQVVLDYFDDDEGGSGLPVYTLQRFARVQLEARDGIYTGRVTLLERRPLQPTRP